MEITLENLPENIICLVGNIVDAHPFGEDKEIIHGTKHFSPGTKVYCSPSKWGDGYEQILVYGKHRGQAKYVSIITDYRYIENFRVKVEYSPKMIERLVQNHINWDSKKEAQDYADYCNSRCHRLKRQWNNENNLKLSCKSQN